MRYPALPSPIVAFVLVLALPAIAHGFSVEQDNNDLRFTSNFPIPQESIARSGRDRGFQLTPRLVLTPSIQHTFDTTDNFYFSSSDQDEERASGFRVSPAIGLNGTFGEANHQYSAGYRGEIGYRDTDSDDGYFDNQFDFRLATNPRAKHGFSVSSNLRTGHDPFGQRRTEGSNIENRDLDEWRTVSGQLGYRLGNPTSRMNLALRLRGLTKDYTTNESVTRFQDYSNVSTGASLGYRVRPKLFLVFDFDAGTTNFPNNNSATSSASRDSDNYRALTGIQWIATAKTTGTVKLGYRYRDPDSSARDDFSGLDWQVSVGWHPKSYSEVRLAAGSRDEESYLDDTTFIEYREVGLTWLHDWTHWMRTRLGGTYASVDFEDDPEGREDDLVRVRATVEFDVGDHLSIRTGWRYTTRDSEDINSDSALDYDRHTFFVGVGGYL